MTDSSRRKVLAAYTAFFVGRAGRAGRRSASRQSGQEAAATIAWRSMARAAAAIPRPARWTSRPPPSPRARLLEHFLRLAFLTL